MRMRLLMICGVVVVLYAGVTGAEQGKLFEKLDIDKSGVISREEFVSCPLVRDSAGRIQHQELCADPATVLSIEEKNRLFDTIDTDKKGAVTRKKLNRFATPDGFAPIRF